jgi:hypothetical protein
LYKLLAFRGIKEDMLAAMPFLLRGRTLFEGVVDLPAREGRKLQAEVPN